MSKLPIFGLFVGNLKPKFKCFFKPKLKPITFLLNCHPVLLALRDGFRRLHPEDEDALASDSRVLTSDAAVEPLTRGKEKSQVK